MNLAYSEMGEGNPVIVLHGLFGSSDNWQTLGKRISEDFRVFLVDQRNHGKSPHSGDFSYRLLADDLADFMDEHALPSAIIVGHSMGGKTAMAFAQLFPERVQKLIVVDMGVKRYAMHHQDVLAGFKAVDLDELTFRREAEEQMEALIPDFGTRQFLLKNLYRKTKDSFAWRINLPVLEEKMDEILAPIADIKVDIPTLFIRGERSNYILDADKAEILRIFPGATFANLPTAHWVHAEDPDGFYKIFMAFVTP